MKTALVLLLFFIFVASTSAQYANLSVQNPQLTQHYGTGTVDSATFTVTPKGIYAQCDFQLTVSARGLEFGSAESLEVQCDFSLPGNITIDDLWLWVGNELSRGLILDRNLAISTYEGIVRRRRDPCLLTKENTYSSGEVHYSMKIYPMHATGTRTVKFSYLVPMNLAGSTASISLPRHLFAMGSVIPDVKILVGSGPGFSKARIMELPGLSFGTQPDTAGRPWISCTLPANSVAQSSGLTLAMDRTTGRECSFSAFSDKGEQFYQLAVFPSALMGGKAIRKVAVLVDFDSTAASLMPEALLSDLQTALSASLTAQDSFNVFYSGIGGMRWKSGGWMAATSEIIGHACTFVASQSPGKATGLPNMLQAGVEFIRSTGGEGVVLLLSSSADYVSPAVADSVVSILAPWLTPDIPVEVADITKPYYRGFYAGSTSYYNNRYFDQKLASMTGGQSFDLMSPNPPNVPALLTQVCTGLQILPDAFDLYVAPHGGLTYLHYEIPPLTNAPISWAHAVLQTGKYAGGLPVNVTASILYRGSVYSKTFSIDSLSTTDSTLRQFWAGARVNDLERTLPSYMYWPYSGTYPQELTSISMDMRVLSRVTAFLSLEPGDTLRACVTCLIAARVTSVSHSELPVVSDSLMQVYPNPFNLSTNIRIRLPRGVRPEQAQVRLVNTLGQVVRTFDTSLLSDESAHSYVWDGKNDRGSVVSSGVYFLVLSSPKGTTGTRLMMMK